MYIVHDHGKPDSQPKDVSHLEFSAVYGLTLYCLCFYNILRIHFLCSYRNSNIMCFENGQG